MEPYEIPRGCITISGKPVECASPVRGIEEHGMQFRPGRGARKRMALPNLIILHHTGGEGDAAGVFRVLNERGLGIEYVIDREGVIWEMCDPAKVDSFDSGNLNSRSVGIEIISCGVAPLPKSAQDRGTYEATINGHGFTFAKYYGCQLKAMADLCDSLTAGLRIPRVFATRPGLLPPDGLARFRGVMGHYQGSAIKCDPGPEPFAYLRDRGYAPSDFAV
jgi:N-acetyl-anhydromuramyl-L-alanine amidase AmpD